MERRGSTRACSASHARRWQNHWTPPRPPRKPERAAGTQERALPTIASLVAAHRAGALSPEQTIERCYARIREYNDPAIFITLRAEEEVRAEARALARDERPLLGVPVAVKDNIDVAGLPTTAGCPAFAYQPGKAAGAGGPGRGERPVLGGPVGVKDNLGGARLAAPAGLPGVPLKAGKGATVV